MNERESDGEYQRLLNGAEPQGLSLWSQDWKCITNCAINEALQVLKVYGISLQDPRTKAFCVITPSHGIAPFTILIRLRTYLEDLDILKNAVDREDKGLNEYPSFIVLVLCNCVDKVRVAPHCPSLSLSAFISSRLLDAQGYRFSCLITPSLSRREPKNRHALLHGARGLRCLSFVELEDAGTMALVHAG